jgi:hypothetical protein
MALLQPIGRAKAVLAALGDRNVQAAFAPSVAWALAPDETVIAGASHEYRFEIRRPDGSVTVVERRYTPVPIDPDERDWWRRCEHSIVVGDPVNMGIWQHEDYDRARRRPVPAIQGGGGAARPKLEGLLHRRPARLPR